MDMSDTLITIFDVEPEGIDGRTTIQKLTYFISTELNIDAGYKADLYGPYSSLVATQLQTLVGLDFVFEKRRRTVRDRIMYSYHLTEDGQELAKKVKKESPETYLIIKNVVEKCKKIVHYNFHVLSWAAKVHFILRQTDKAITYKEVMDATQLFGWKLGQKEIESGVKLLTALRLIKRGQ